MYKRVQARTYEILEKAVPGDVLSKIFDIFIMSLILLNVCVVIMETVEKYSIPYAKFFYYFELVSVLIFTIEYVLRIWACTVDEKYAHPLIGRIRFALNPLALVDLIAILPFYLPMVFKFDLRFIRALRLLRLLRLLKVGRYSDTMVTFGSGLKEKKEELVITLFIIFILLVVVSSLMYFIENQAQPEVFSSIPASMWWGIATLSTVGYGDVYPVTTLGKFFGALIAILGIGMFALPAGILGSGFVDAVEQKKKQKEKKTCPHCGKDLRT